MEHRETTLRQRIRARLKLSKLRQKDLAERIGVSESHMSEMLSDRAHRRISTDHLARIAAALGTTESELYGQPAQPQEFEEARVALWTPPPASAFNLTALVPGAPPRAMLYRVTDAALGLPTDTVLVLDPDTPPSDGSLAVLQFYDDAIGRAETILAETWRGMALLPERNPGRGVPRILDLSGDDVRFVGTVISFFWARRQDAGAP